MTESSMPEEVQGEVDSSGPEHVAVCACSWAASTRGDSVDRRSVETVAKAHTSHCGPVELRRVDEPAGECALAELDGEIISTFGGSA